MKIDVLGIQDVGINWSNCKVHDSLRNRMKFHGWEFSRMILSHNKKCDIGTQQYGGTLTFLKDQVTYYWTNSGIDESGLGRWSWVQLKRTNKSSAKIFTVYQPVIVNDPMYSSSVYQQQKRYFTGKGVYICPNELLRKDLKSAIKTCQQRKEKVL